jgi:hypothetical protein
MAVVTVSGLAGGLAQEIVAEPHRLAADEPRSAGGTDLLLGALGA